MTPEQIARATEPFYTTKPEGRGTGLGLSMVLGFAKQSGGHLQLHSEPGRGTTARLYIPRTHLPARDAERSPLDVPRSHAATVLLVEDDAAVRLVARDALRSLGYAVEEAADADAALALLRAGLRPEVLFTDVVMPGTMNGKALADEARRLQPGVAVLLTSGYSQDKTTSAGRTGAAPPLLSKPWQTAQLARALNDALLLARHGGEPDAPAGPPRVLLVEDEEMVRLTTADALGELGFDVVKADTAQGALARLDPPPDLLLTDLGLPDQDGTWLVSEVRRHLPGLPVIIASGQADPQKADVVWLAKPYDMPGLTAALGAALPAQPNLRRPGLLRPEPVQAGTP
jgi:CheY-like chemotaxis protein